MGATTQQPDVTAVIPRPAPVNGLHPARLTDLEGRPLTAAMLPVNARVVTRGQRVFMHYAGDEWRQVPSVELGTDGRPI